MGIAARVFVLTMALVVVGCAPAGVSQEPAPVVLTVAVTPTPTLTPAPTVSAVAQPTWEGCVYTWATRSDPETSQALQDALDAAQLGDVTGAASLFGEDCLRSSGEVTFGAMNTDFHIDAVVPTIDDPQMLGDLALAIFDVIWGVPVDTPMGIGNVSLSFTSEDGEARVQLGGRLIEEIRQSGVTGADAWMALLEASY